MISKETCGFFIQQIYNALEKNANNQLRKKELTFSQMFRKKNFHSKSLKND